MVLLTAGQLWQYWLVAASILISRSVSGSLALALATDLLPAGAVGRSLPWLNTVTWVASVMGFAGTGYVLETMGAASLFGLGALFALGAAGLVAVIPARGQESVLARLRWVRRWTEPARGDC